MPATSQHLIERAAARLCEEGRLDPCAAQLLAAEPASSFAEPGASPSEGRAAIVPTVRPIIDQILLDHPPPPHPKTWRNRVGEEFRVTQGQILRAAFSGDTGGAAPANLLMVTSARPGEGKTFAALNLAAGIAHADDRAVLLLDIDRKPASLSHTLGLSEAPGLLDLAADPSLNPGEVIVPTAFEKLCVLPLGRDQNDGTDPLATRQMTRLIRDLGRRYDDRLVILDAPPCLASSGPSTLAPIVGQILLVVEAGRTQREELEAAVDLIQACPTISLLLNKVRLTTRSSFGSYASAPSL
jgi:protein-tyrosine kinase